MKAKNLSNLRSWLLFTFLVLLSIAGNYFRIPLFFGVDFLFGSIALLIIAYFYGVLLSITAAVIAGVWTYFLWGHWYAIIIFTLEILFVHRSIHRVKRKNEFNTTSNLLFLVDGLYWLIIGMPLVWVLYHYFLHLDIQTTVLIMLKQSFNGLFNSLIATLAITYLSFEKWVKTPFSKKDPILVKDFVFRLSFSFVISIVMLLMVLNTRQEYQRMLKGIQSEFQIEHTHITANINVWLREQMHDIKALAEVGANSTLKPSEKLQQSAALIKQANPNLYNVYIADETGTTVAFYPAVNENGESTLGLNFSDRQYYKDLKETLQPVISDVFAGRGGVFSPIITLSVPIVKEGSFRGFTLGALNPEQMITNLLNRIKEGNKAIEISIVDRTGNVIASTLPELKPMDRYELGKNQELRPLGNNVFHMLSQDENLPTMTRWGESSIVLEKPISNYLPWRIVLQTELTPFRESFYNFYIFVFAILLLITSITLLVSMILSRRIAGPLVQLGWITANLPEKVVDHKGFEWPTTRILEIKILIENFKSMASTLSNSIQMLKNQNQKLNYFANYDSLTGLPNRRLFNEELQNALEIAGQKKQSVAVLFVDIDNFKNANDIVGHNLGDELLKMVAVRLKSCLGHRQSVLSRFGCDEFAVMLSGAIQRSTVNYLPRQILRNISQPFLINNFEVNLTASIGISLYPKDGDSATSLIANADIAMCHVKEQGGNYYQFHSADMKVKLLERLQMVNDLRRAIQREEFMMYYQPKVDLNNGSIKGAEVLIRWNHPTLGILQPNRFLSFAEQTGQIVPITEWVLYSVCKQMMTWQKKGYSPIQVAVNISPKHFQRNNPAEVIERVLRETKLASDYLSIEITENSMMQNMEFTTQALFEIKKLGVQISLDDFGTGYSSLNYLHQLPIDEIKIDRSFIKDVSVKEETAAITKTIISLAQTLNLKVTAEGVETEEQLDFFRQHKCDFVQGYFFSEPVPADRFQQMLFENNFLSKIS